MLIICKKKAVRKGFFKWVQCLKRLGTPTLGYSIQYLFYFIKPMSQIGDNLLYSEKPENSPQILSVS